MEVRLVAAMCNDILLLLLLLLLLCVWCYRDLRALCQC